MSVLDIFGMFDKLDDIIYKPVEAICDWVEEPLKKWEHKRKMDANAQDVQAKENMRRLEAELEMEREQQAVELQAQSKRWDAEIQQMIAEQEDARRDKFVEALTKYQIQLASAYILICTFASPPERGLLSPDILPFCKKLSSSSK